MTAAELRFEPWRATRAGSFTPSFSAPAFQPAASSPTRASNWRLSARRESAFSPGAGVVRNRAMTTLTIELPDEAARHATEQARRAHLTLAEWVRVRIAGRRGMREVAERDRLGYPPGWFERTCGSLAGVEDFREPADAAVAPLPPIEL